MLLYCFSCNRVHELSAGNAERIIYALQGGLADAEMREANKAITIPEDGVACLMETLRDSYDAEAYGEWTNNAIESRQRLAGGQE